MAFTPLDVQTLARLTQIRLDSGSSEKLADTLAQLTALAEPIRNMAVRDTLPLINPLDMTQRLRADVVSEENRRELYQSIAPATEDGLYLVPKVLD